MKPALIDAILNQVDKTSPRIAAVIMEDGAPYEFYQVWCPAYANAEEVDWEHNRYFLLLVLAAEGVEVEWVAAE